MARTGPGLNPSSKGRRLNRLTHGRVPFWKTEITWTVRTAQNLFSGQNIQLLMLTLWYIRKCCSLNGKGGSSVDSENGRRCTELFGIACRGLLCCHPTSTLRCKPACRPAALLISIDDMQNDSSLHLATGKWHRLYIGHSAPSSF